MKKSISLLLSFSFIVGVNFGANKVHAETANLSSNSTFKYEITPASAEWKNYSPLELKRKLNISTTEAQKMDTNTLLNLTLNYPYLGDIYAVDDPTKALDFIKKEFNGLEVLLQRDDLKDKLITHYNDLSDKIFESKDNENIDSYKERFKYKFQESLLSSPKIFDKLNNDEKKSIIINSQKVSYKIDTNPIAVENTSTFGLLSVSKLVLDRSYKAIGLVSANKTQKLITFTSLPIINPPQISGGNNLSGGWVITPKSSIVEVLHKQEMTAGDVTACSNYGATVYPNATKLRNATWNYNCHSYAWYSTSTSNTWWMNSPSAYMSDGSYTQTNTPQSGYKIFYPDPESQHSGIITTPSSNYQNMVVTSKWGALGLYRHNTMYCPYASLYMPTYWK